MVVDMTKMRILLLALSLGFAGGFGFTTLYAERSDMPAITMADEQR